MQQSEAVKVYLSELVEVSRRHGLWLSHEDTEGGFEVLARDTHPDASHSANEEFRNLEEWLLEAADKTKTEPPITSCTMRVPRLGETFKITND